MQVKMRLVMIGYVVMGLVMMKLFLIECLVYALYKFKNKLFIHKETLYEYDK